MTWKELSSISTCNNLLHYADNVHGYNILIVLRNSHFNYHTFWTFVITTVSHCYLKCLYLISEDSIITTVWGLSFRIYLANLHVAKSLPKNLHHRKTLTGIGKLNAGQTYVVAVKMLSNLLPEKSISFLSQNSIAFVMTYLQRYKPPNKLCQPLVGNT